MSSSPSRAHSGTVHQLEVLSHRPALPSARPASVLLGTAQSEMQARRRDPSSQRATAGIRARATRGHSQRARETEADGSWMLGTRPGSARGREAHVSTPFHGPAQSLMRARPIQPASDSERLGRRGPGPAQGTDAIGPWMLGTRPVQARGRGAHVSTPARPVSTPIAQASDSRHPSQTPVAHGPSVER